jgi:hypothetical protein
MKTHRIVRGLIGLMAVASSLNAQPFIPGGVNSAGVSYLVADMPVWYHTGPGVWTFFAGLARADAVNPARSGTDLRPGPHAHGR